MSQLKGQIQKLYQLFLVTLAALLLFSGTLNFILLWQVISIHRAVSQETPVFSRLLTTYERHDLPKINEFVQDLVRFSRAHPDFKPILDKYLPTNAQGLFPAPALPGAASAPSAGQTK